MTLVLKSRVASDGAFCISFYERLLSWELWALSGVRKLPTWGEVLAPSGYGAYPTWASVLPIS